MKTIVKYIFILSVLFLSCDKDEGKLPNIVFKSGGGYISSDVTVDKGSQILIGVTASKSEKEDVLKKFDISLSKNGAALTSVVNKDLNGSEGDSYDYDYSAKLDSIAGQTYHYILSVTNRDGLNNKVEVTITTK